MAKKTTRPSAPKATPSKKATTKPRAGANDPVFAQPSPTPDPSPAT